MNTTVFSVVKGPIFATNLKNRALRQCKSHISDRSQLDLLFLSRHLFHIPVHNSLHALINTRLSRLGCSPYIEKWKCALSLAEGRTGLWSPHPPPHTPPPLARMFSQAAVARNWTKKVQPNYNGGAATVWLVLSRSYVCFIASSCEFESRPTRFSFSFVGRAT